MHRISIFEAILLEIPTTAPPSERINLRKPY